MKKKYGWIYVLPILMVFMILSFGVLGVRSAIGEQRMQQELKKLQWVKYDDTEEELEYQGKKTNMDPESLRELFGEDLLIWTDFCDGLALLYYKDRIVCVNEEGETVFEKKARIPKRYIEGGTTETNTTMTGLNRDGFRDGLAVFTLDGCKYGVLDQEGNVVIEPVFKGKRSLKVMEDRHIRVFYERVFSIGKLYEQEGGMICD